MDFSPQSRVAALTASELAGSWPSPLILLHVVHEKGDHVGFYREHGNEDATNGNGKVLRPIADIAREMLDKFLGELQFDHPDAPGLEATRTMIVTGVPSKRIVEVAERYDASMIVMGSQGRTGIPHWLIGSVAEQVTRHSRRPVMITKDTEFDEGRTGSAQTHRPGHGAASNGAVSL